MPVVKKTVNLIADIGGTNIRIAQVDENNRQKFTALASYQCADFDSLADVVSCYLKSQPLTGCLINACFAIACPADNDLIAMTNLPWKFSQKALKQQLKLNSLSFINDYTAIAMAIPLLTDQQKVKIGGGTSVANKPIAVCGPGTGLGVANLVPINHAGVNQWHCFSGEGGHIDFAAINETEQQVMSYINTLKKRVSYEQLLSGYGLEQIYQALLAINDEPSLATLPKQLSAKEISHQAVTQSCKICQQTLTLFCNVLGSFAGNLALIMDSQGGVYIAGGIVPRFIDYLKQSDFRKRFETKGRLSHITEQTPTYVITEQQPGLLGAAAYLLQGIPK
jgi:glucokinase